MLKMSESTPATGQLLKTLLAQVFPEDQGGGARRRSRPSLARLPFDHLFTGATSVGRVMRAAADNLTPVTLELGGKSPAIVPGTVPLADAAERIAFGKCMNAGQTCVGAGLRCAPRASRASSAPTVRPCCACIRAWPTTPTTAQSSMPDS